MMSDTTRSATSRVFAVYTDTPQVAGRGVQ
jgi:hypothetical protein